MDLLDSRLFDAAIVGAGPAGAHLAALLARRGCAVAVVDKSRFPRDKVCGGGISAKSARLVGPELAPLVQRRIEGAWLTVGNRGVQCCADGAVGCTVLRREFDDFLLRRAIAAGTRFFAEAAFVDADLPASDGIATLHTTRGAVRARLVVGADGVASALRARLFGKRLVRYAPALEALVTSARDTTPFETRALFDFGALPRGYGWVFPARGHLNAGVYSPFGGRSLRARLDAFLARYDGLRQPRAIRYQGYAIPVQNRGAQFQRGPAWLVGDAAGLADALFGEGIYFALQSAELAAQALAETGFAPTSPRYGELLRQRLLPELRASQWLARLLYAAPALPARLLRSPRAVSSFAGVVSGAVGYRACLLRALAGGPAWLLARPLPAALPAL